MVPLTFEILELSIGLFQTQRIEFEQRKWPGTGQLDADVVQKLTERHKQKAAVKK